MRTRYESAFDREREIREAIAAGERALVSLRDAKERLDSARRWGVVDLFGGGMISGFIKHSRVNDASRILDRAKYDLELFQRELADVQDIRGLDVGVDDFLTFADFFFDGFLADLFVQSRIGVSRRKIEEAIPRVEEMLGRLRRCIRGLPG